MPSDIETADHKWIIRECICGCGNVDLAQTGEHAALVGIERRHRPLVEKLVSAANDRDRLAAELAEAVRAWQVWSADLLTSLDLQLDGGLWGDDVAREKLRATVAAMRAVVEAAGEWRDAWQPCHRAERRLRSNDALQAAIDHYRAAKKEQSK